MPKADLVAKKDILEIEKRVVDLELAVNELKESFKSLDLSAIPDLKQRLEDVEDLVMVENAGIIELKKMLEELSTKVTSTEITLPPNLEERLSSLEEKVKNITIPEVPSLQPLEEKIISSVENIKTEFYSKLSDVEKRFIDFEEKLSSIPDQKKLKEETKDAVLSSLPDFKKIESKLIDSMETFKTDMEMKKQSVERILEDIKEQLKKPLPERALEELEKIRNDWLVNNTRVDAVEKFVQDFAKEINAIKPTIKKLETFEKIIDLKKDVDEKLQEFRDLQKGIKKEFKLAQEETQKLTEKNKVLLIEIEKSVKRAEEKLRDLAHITTAISRLSKDIEKNKEQISKMAKIDEVKSIARGLELMMSDYKSLVNDISKRIEELQTNVTKKLNEMKSQSLAEVRSEIQVLKEDIEKLSKDLEKSKIEVSSMVKKDEISSIAKKLEMLEVRMKELKIDELQKLLDNTNLRVNQIEEGLKKEIEEIRTGITNRIEELKTSPTFINQQINELLNRVVFLESRLIAVESMMQETSRSLPIILE